jgi:GNAT superfamily N-acetyltransferase
MWWRVNRSAFEQQKGQQNKNALRAIILASEIPGLLAYINGQPVAWCAVAPRETYPVLERSRTLKRVDAEPVWSIVCFFIHKQWRRQGISVQLLAATITYARAQGAQVVEGYPVEPRTANMPDVFAWTGTVKAFRQAGFVEVARRSETRPIMRYTIASKRSMP